jgi:hypothetical protein
MALVQYAVNPPEVVVGFLMVTSGCQVIFVASATRKSVMTPTKPQGTQKNTKP